MHKTFFTPRFFEVLKKNGLCLRPGLAGRFVELGRKKHPVGQPQQEHTTNRDNNIGFQAMRQQHPKIKMVGRFGSLGEE